MLKLSVFINMYVDFILNILYVEFFILINTYVEGKYFSVVIFLK